MNLAAAFLIISAVIFSMFRGLKSTNVTEIFKMVVVLATSLIVVPQVWNAVGVDVIIKGMSGVTGGYGDLWGSSESIAFFLSTGIYFVFRHISLPWADNSFWQRAFVIKPEKIKITYALAALLFFVSPALFATLGFIGAGMGMTPTNVQLTNVYVIAQILSPWALILVVFMLLTALTSLLDSQITSITTLVSHDIVPQLTSNSNDARSIDIGRIVVISLVLLSWAIVNIPGVNILYFGLLLGCICMTFFVPSVVALFKPELLQSRSMVAGILLALFIGFPLYAYASLNKMVDLSLIGFFACLIISAGVSLIGSKLEK
jgi:Na+/proline symporter